MMSPGGTSGVSHHPPHHQHMQRSRSASNPPHPLPQPSQPPAQLPYSSRKTNGELPSE